jgi:VanZ family protein
MAVIFVLSSRPRLPMPLTFDGGDKVAHILAYCVLGMLLTRGWRTTNWREYAGMASLGSGLLYGGLDEYHQRFVRGRTPDVYDLAADAVGLMVAMLVTRWWRGRGC